MKYQSQMRNVPPGLKNHSQTKAEAYNIPPVYCQTLCYRPPFGLSTAECLSTIKRTKKIDDKYCHPQSPVCTLSHHERLLTTSKPNHHRKKAITQKELCPNASPFVRGNLLRMNKQTCALSLRVALSPEAAALLTPAKLKTCQPLSLKPKKKTLCPTSETSQTSRKSLVGKVKPGLK